MQNAPAPTFTDPTQWLPCAPCMSTTRHDRDATGTPRCYMDPRHPNFDRVGGQLPKVNDGYAARIARHREAITQEEEQGRYVYTVEGEPMLGSLGHYAKALEMAHYSGLGVSHFLGRVRTDANGEAFTVEMVEPELDTSANTGDDYSRTTVRVGEEVASFRIDLRA